MLVTYIDFFFSIQASIVQLNGKPYRRDWSCCTSTKISNYNFEHSDIIRVFYYILIE